jgi:hypothetical protein
VKTIIIVLLFIISVAKASDLYVDKEACPFEGCQYGIWVAEENNNIYSNPNDKSKQIGNIKKGDTISAVTGEVHTWPQPFIVNKAKDDYNIGDTIWVYTYKGEGHFKIKYKENEFEEINLYFSPYGNGKGSKCEDPNCFGIMKNELKCQWWVKILTKDKLTGWINGYKKFKGKDKFE